METRLSGILVYCLSYYNKKYYRRFDIIIEIFINWTSLCKLYWKTKRLNFNEIFAELRNLPVIIYKSYIIKIYL